MTNIFSTDIFNFYVLTALFPVRASKLGKIYNFHTCLLLHKIFTGEVATVLEVPESGIIHTKEWVEHQSRWLPKHVRVNWTGLTYGQ
jgi:hypothetical protein